MAFSFSDSEGEEEGKLIGNLVFELINTTDELDLLGFVAVSDKKVVGSLFFSRLMLSCDKVAFILSPVAVATEEQGKGIGQQLIKYGIAHLSSMSLDLVFTYGDPNYYSKVGFEHISEHIVKAPLKLTYPEGWLAQSLNKVVIDVSGVSSQCVKAMNDQRYW